MQRSPAMVLELLKIDSSLKMSLFENSDFAQTLRHYSQVKVSFGQVADVCSEIGSILKKAGKGLSADDAPLKGLKKCGRLLWDQLLTKSVKEKIRSAASADILLSLDEELISIPWELLFDGRDFLCLKHNVGRLLRTGHSEPHPVYRSAGPRLRMLILSDPTSDLKAAYKEGIAIRNTLDSRRHALSIDFKSTKIDTLYVKKNLGEYDIVHYAGHCEYDRLDPQNSGWVLSDARLTCRDIMTLGESYAMPSLLFSNACQSAQSSDSALCNDEQRQAGIDGDQKGKVSLSNDYQEKTYGIASSFLFSGVRHYIGAIQRIEDPVSLVYAKEFYKILRRGRSIGESVRVSRMKLVREYGMSALFWASYLLYGDPGFALFKKPGVSGRQQEKETAFASRAASWAGRHRRALVAAGSCAAALAIAAGLYCWLPSLNPGTYYLMHSARKELAAGRNERAIIVGRQIISRKRHMLAVYPVIAEANARLGKRSEALQNYFDYAVASEKFGKHKKVAYAYSMIGWLYQQMGYYTKAFDFYQKSLEQSRANHDRLNEAIAMRKLAVWYMDKDDNDKALELLTRSSEINREHAGNAEHRYNLACDYFDLGLLFSNKDDLATAKDFYLKSLRLFERMKKRDEESDYYFNLGEINLMEKEYVKALDCYNKGLAIDQAHNNLPSIAQDYAMIGELYMDMDNLDMAEGNMKKSLELAQNIDCPPEVASAAYDLGLLYKKRGHTNKARKFFRQAQEIYANSDSPGYEELKKELMNLE